MRPCFRAVLFLFAVGAAAGALSTLHPAPARADSEGVIGADNSWPVLDPAKVPAAWQNRRKPIAVLIRIFPGFICKAGSGFLISDDCMLTAAHSVLDNAGAVLPPNKISVNFNAEKTVAPFNRSRGCFDSCFVASDSVDAWKPSSVTILSPRDDLDVALLKFAVKNGKKPGDLYGHVKVALREPVVGEKVHLIHHPGGGCKEYSNDDDAKVVDKDSKDCPTNETDVNGKGKFTHKADTDEGSSGAPVFDNDGCAIGVHTGEVTIGTDTKNCATKLLVIKKAVTDAGCTFDECQPVPAIPTTWGRVKAMYR